MPTAVSKLAFQPPRPGTECDDINDNLKRQPGYVELQTASGVTVPLVCCMPRGTRPAKIRRCLLFSHGNAEDLGDTLPFLSRCAEFLQVPVIGYEYPGYGLARHGGSHKSNGGGGGPACEPSEQGCFEAAEAAYAHVRGRWPEWQVVLFGRSLGSGPACFIAEQAGGAKLAGLILLSPLCSGIATQLGPLARVLRPIDLFVNTERIRSICCPVVVLHGTADWVVPCSHGRTLHRLALHSCEPLWARGKGHNDMPEADIFRHICGFVAELP